MTKKLVRRVRRRAMGGLFDIRIYDDGSVRCRVDHPDNDPEIEFAMAGRFYGLARDIFREHGLGEPVLGPVSWRNDPPLPTSQGATMNADSPGVLDAAWAAAEAAAQALGPDWHLAGVHRDVDSDTVQYRGYRASANDGRFMEHVRHAESPAAALHALAAALAPEASREEGGA